VTNGLCSEERRRGEEKVAGAAVGRLLNVKGRLRSEKGAIWDETKRRFGRSVCKLKSETQVEWSE
jgi:hypothetical protein